MKPTIITLSPSDSGNDTVTVSSFEEAFGEFSEARGRGRQRRAKRKAERQKNRQTKRMTRITNRAERKNARQTMRAQQQEARQMRKDTRKSRKVARKSMGEEEESAELQNQDGGAQDEGAQDGGATQSEEQASEEQGGEDVGNEGGEDMGNEGGEDMGEGGEEESGFDGDTFETDDAFSFLEGDDFYNAESDDYFVNADGNNERINPKVKSVAQKIEDGKEYIASLQTVLANAQSDTDKNKVNARIYNVSKTLSELEGSLEGYSSARGRGKQERNRKREVRKAKSVARKNRVIKKIGGKKDIKSIAKSLASMYPPAIALKMAQKLVANRRNNGGDETPVDVELNPEFSQDKIVVPASEQGEGANGETGLIGMDNQQDFDAPEVRQFDLTFSGADGESNSKINFKALAIGVGVGILAIYIIKKYKLLGDK